jgi:hypothetical protein
MDGRVIAKPALTKSSWLVRACFLAFIARECFLTYLTWSGLGESVAFSSFPLLCLLGMGVYGSRFWRAAYSLWLSAFLVLFVAIYHEDLFPLEALVLGNRLLIAIDLTLLAILFSPPLSKFVRSFPSDWFVGLQTAIFAGLSLFVLFLLTIFVAVPIKALICGWFLLIPISYCGLRWLGENKRERRARLSISRIVLRGDGS